VVVPAGEKRVCLPFAVIGAVCIVGGGLVAAVTALAPSEQGSWAAAYLVLVGGVGQIALAAGQAVFSPWVSTRLLAAQLTGWNAGNAAVLGGTLLGLTALIDAGGGLLVATLALFAHAMHTATAPLQPGRRRWLLIGYRLLVLIVLVSIPIGLVLARLRG
jgi:hypothetical protein